MATQDISRYLDSDGTARDSQGKKSDNVLHEVNNRGYLDKKSVVSQEKPSTIHNLTLPEAQRTQKLTRVSQITLSKIQPLELDTKFATRHLHGS